MMGGGENVTGIIIPLNAYILKMIGKLDSVDVNFSSINPINLLLTLNKTKPEMIHFNRFSEASTPVWFQTIAEKIQQIRGLQALRVANEGERKLFSQIWNELRDKYQPSRGDKVEVLFPNDFNDKNVPQNIKP
uniref:Bm10084 n=1 Tax=Brugia malayi TaxID=6279 RepID=A0A1I9GC57_BRUMA|nr:Bm10084 [Brugia malayi]